MHLPWFIGHNPGTVSNRCFACCDRLAESNLQAICRDILALYESEGRRLVADAVSAGLLAAVAEGPRATEQFAAVAAVFVGGLAAGARAQDISARFLEMLVARMQQVGVLRCNGIETGTVSVVTFIQQRRCMQHVGVFVCNSKQLCQAASIARLIACCFQQLVCWVNRGWVC